MPLVIVEEDNLLLTSKEWTFGEACGGCGVSFARIFRQQRHCRLCGKSFCDACSPKNAKTSILSPESYRICQACSDEVNARNLELQRREEEGEPVVQLKMPKLEEMQHSHLTRIARTTKLGRLLWPILNNFRITIKQVQAERKAFTDDAAFEARRAEVMDLAYEREAVAMKNVVISMGGLYNKGAQLAASQKLIMPPKLVEELQTCFEAMPARDWKYMRHALCQFFGEGDLKRGSITMAEHFKSFSKTALAAASIGQVHCARLRSGEKVVVKVLYPEIRKNMKADLATMKTSIVMIVKMLGLEDMQTLIEKFYAEVASNFPRELDFRIELTHMEYAARLLERHSPDIVVPTAYARLSGVTVLTQSMVKGQTLHKIGENKDSNPEMLAKARIALDKVVAALGRMIFHDGFFHADPHPGNIMVMPDGRPAMIDWGQCMNLTRAQRRRLCQIVIMLRTRNIGLITMGLNMTGFSLPADESSATAAFIFFFFDSSLGGPFSDDIKNFGSTLRNTPNKIQVPTDMPKEVIFFARVMQCLRRDCEVLGVDISAIDCWAPIARQALRAMVYERETVAITLREKSLSPRGEDDDEDDTSTWSPSRMMLMLNTAEFDTVQVLVEWAQKHPQIGDMALSLLGKHKGLIFSAAEAFLDSPQLWLAVLACVAVLISLLAFKGLLSIFF